MHMIANPGRVEFDMRDKSPPRIISVVRKSHGFCSQSNYRAKLTDDVLLKRGNERNWWTRRASIRCGQLVVSTSHGADGPTSFKLSLRHMSLRSGPVPNSFSLCKGQNVILTLQISTRRAFDEWVKAVAIELIRQTPLGDVKYLDIFTLQDSWNPQNTNCDKDWNFNDNCASHANSKCCDICDTNIQFNSSYPTAASPLRSDSSFDDDVVVEEKYVQDLLRRCQNTESYVPVKDKLFLFESLCKLGRKVRSTEDVPSRVGPTSNKRAKSLNDLSHSLGSHNAVREICKYFENKTNSSLDSRSALQIQRLGNSYNHLDHVNRYVDICNT